jgi:hypothetical protein
MNSRLYKVSKNAIYLHLERLLATIQMYPLYRSMNTAIEVKTKQINDIHVFEFHGELDETNADKTFTSIYNEIGDFSGKKVLFNLV